MKVYVNKSQEMRTLFFTDGTAIFMFRGQKVETDKEVVSIPDGVSVSEKKEPITRRKKTSSQKEPEHEDGSDEEDSTE